MFKPDFVTKKIDTTDSYGKFVFTPFPAGYGHSLGNALRRVLLSSIEGTAVTYVKINNVVHPFSTISGIKESVLDMIFNIKRLRFRLSGEGPYTLSLKTSSKGKVTAKELKGGDVEVVNKNQLIAEITKDKTKLEIELTVERGVGFSASEEKKKAPFGTIAVDSVFSPVIKVNYTVEGERVGRRTNYDKLILEIWTDGSIKPQDALKTSASTLEAFYGYILSGKDEESRRKEEETSAEEARAVDEKVFETIIDELDLPTRVINALLRE
ncbi:MAG: DNA-directed RNA polymerase subunit alpha, partial [Candidatus Paceibacterota bacterium]